MQFIVDWWPVFILVVDIVIRVAAIIIVPRNRRPGAAMAWLLAIYFIPFVGVLLFLLIGTPRLPRKRRRKQDAINEYIRETSAHLDFGTLRPHAPEWFTSMVTMNRTLGAMPLSGDNSAHLIDEYQESLDAMADAIRAARKYVHIEFYILQTDVSTEGIFRAMPPEGSPCASCSTIGRTAASLATARPSSASSRWAPTGT
jgi:cardiolipin synthase A/B